MEQRMSASMTRAQKHTQRPSGSHGRGLPLRPAVPTRGVTGPGPGKTARRNGVRPAVTARGRALLEQQRREAA
jgi:hypothetical protein